MRRPWYLSKTTPSLANLNKGSQRMHLVFGGDCRARGDGEHLERYVVLPNV
jgi:hypothetical protein